MYFGDLSNSGGKMMRSILGGFIFVLLLACGLVFASPYIALEGLRDALESGDAEDISNRIDFPLLRLNMKEQLNATMAKNVDRESEDNPFAALATSMASLVIENALDALVTPAGVAKLVAGQQLLDPEGADENQIPDDDSNTRRNLLSEARVVHDSLDSVSVWVPNDYGNEFRIVMRRFGMTWKLTNVILSESGV
jgi:hypothetical protein